MTPIEYTVILFVILLILVLFLLPTAIAFCKGHQYRWIILFINVVFGFTLIGWFGALIWSIAGDDIV